MRSVSFLTLVTTILLTAACSSGKPPAIVSPESLLDRSSERVTFSLAAPTAQQDIAEWLLKDLPSRVELECEGADTACNAVISDLERRRVPYQAGATGGQPKAVFIYERLMARACDPKYQENSFNPLNRNHAALGCAVSSNTVQSVADADQFSNPPMMDRPAAAAAVRAVRKASR